MFLHLGTQLYGKVDQVPGLFHVATQFFHLNYVPLVPMSSYLVLEGQELPEGTPGLPVEWNAKSVLLAWVRTGLWIGSGILISMSVVETVVCLEGNGDWVAALIMGLSGAGLAVLLPISYRVTRADPLRALALARQAGIEPEVVAKYFVHCSSLPTPEEADGQGVQ